MLSLVYVSRAVVPFADADVAELLRKSREKNTALDLTGILLFKSNQFMQALEGPEDAVRSLYSVIEADPRHSGVRTVLDSVIEERQFPQWSMGYQPVTDDSLRDIPGYNDFLDAGGAGWADPTRAQWLLQWFRTRTL